MDIDPNSIETIQCLRQLNTGIIAQASFDTWSEDLQYNGGDSWLAVVDGDFLPAPPSQLLAEGRFFNVTTMILWCDASMQIDTPLNIISEQDTFDFFAPYLPGLSNQSISDLLSFHPVTDFEHIPDVNLTKGFLRCARIYQDVLVTCQPIGYSKSLAVRSNNVYLIDQNATILSPILTSLGCPGLAPIHTSEFAYTFGNLSHYDVNDYPFNPTAEDYRLEQEEAGSRTAFTSVGQPSLDANKTLQGLGPAFLTINQTAIFVAGGEIEGLSFIDGPEASPPLAAQKLRSRCSVINSSFIIAQLQY